MEKHSAFDGPIPAVGEEFAVDVVASPTRTSYFPDQAAVFTRKANEIEIALLRQEVSLKSQTGTVMAQNGVELEVMFTPRVVVPELTDIAHIRLTMGPALDLAYSIIMHALVQGMPKDEALKRLQSISVEST